jgi:hypothetical protein
MSNCVLYALQDRAIINALAEAALQGADVLVQKYQEREAPRSSGDL